VDWVKKKSGPPSLKLKSVEEAKEFEASLSKNTDDVIVLGFFDKEKDAKQFKKAADGEN